MAEIVYEHFDYRRLGYSGAVELLEELADLYVPVYREPPYNGLPKYGREAFMERTKGQLGGRGFAVVTARTGARLLGFAFGFGMAAGAWWANASLPSAELLNASKFAVIELVVARSHRRRGIGTALMGRLLDGRSEEYGVLAAVPAAPAHGMYVRWGWRPVATFTTPPHAEVLALRLA